MKTIPETTDFNVYWFETRPGKPHPKTGIPPSLYTLKIEDFLIGPGNSIKRKKIPGGGGTFSLTYSKHTCLNLFPHVHYYTPKKLVSNCNNVFHSKKKNTPRFHFA